MSKVAYRLLKKLEEKALGDLIAKCNETVTQERMESFQYAILENAFEVKFFPIKQGTGSNILIPKENSKTDFAPLNPAEWDKGRVFSRDAETRWRKIRDGFHIVFLTDGANVPDEFEEEDIGTLETVDPTKLLLWGEKREDGLWHELRIPNPLGYPVNGTASKAWIQVKEYKQNGITQFVRYCGVVSEG